MIKVWFPLHNHISMFGPQLWRFRTNLSHCWRCPYDGSKLRPHRFLPKTFDKITWNEATYMATFCASSLLVIRWYTITTFFQWFNIFIGCWPAGSSRTNIVILFFRKELVPLVKHIFSPKVDSPNATVNISITLEHGSF